MSNNKNITKDMIKAGIKARVIRLVKSPNGDGVVCKIGDNWFYFGGLEAENAATVQEYQKNVPMDTIIADIYTVLKEFKEYGDELLDEYLYYVAYLEECGIRDC